MLMTMTMTMRASSLAVVFITMMAALLPMHCRARLPSSKDWHGNLPAAGRSATTIDGGDSLPTPSSPFTMSTLPLDGDANAHIVLHLHQHDESKTTSVIAERRNHDGNYPSNDFIHEDYWYSFQPLTSESDTQQWEIHRIPKARKLQSVEPVMEELELENDIDQEEHTGNRISLNQVKNFILAICCVLMAAFAAGLTLGMLSLDPLSLEIKRRASTINAEQMWSMQLLPLLVGHSKRHRLLCSLLLVNALANEALPIFLDDLLPNKVAAIMVSVTLVLIMGEIVPSAIFTGQNQVKYAAKLVPMAKFVMFITAPIAVPIAMVLDRVLHDSDDHSGGSGHGGSGDDNVVGDVTEGNTYNRNELSALVRIQYESQLADKMRKKQANKNLLLTKHNSESSRDSNAIPSSSHAHNSVRSITRELTSEHGMHADEVTMMQGALTMTTKRAADVCTPLRRMYALPSDTVLDENQMVEIWARGYSRVPVYCANPVADASSKAAGGTSLSSFEDVHSIVGVLLVRQLIVVDSTENRPLSTLPLVQPSCVSPSMHLVDLLNLFQASGRRGSGGLHLAIVCACPNLATSALERGESIPKEAGVVGIITLEDVVEELLQEEIYDEADRDLKLSKWGVNKWKAMVKRKKKLGKVQVRESGGVTFVDTAGTESTPLLG